MLPICDCSPNEQTHCLPLELTVKCIHCPRSCEANTLRGYGTEHRQTSASMANSSTCQELLLFNISAYVHCVITFHDFFHLFTIASCRSRRSRSEAWTPCFSSSWASSYFVHRSSIPLCPTNSSRQHCSDASWILTARSRLNPQSECRQHPSAEHSRLLYTLLHLSSHTPTPHSCNEGITGGIFCRHLFS